MTVGSGGIRNFEARHITGDSQPELLVEAWGHSGNMIGISLHMFRWDGGKFIELAGTPFNFSGGIFGQEWAFVEGNDPSQLQVFSSYDNTTTVYEWTGNTYEAVEITQENVLPDPSDQPFAVEWIHRSIEQGNYTEVVAYLEEALQRAAGSANLSETVNSRALQFVLGMNYVYLGNEEMARSVFEALRDESSPSELMGFSQAAGVFLEHYDGLESAYDACSAAYDVLAEDEEYSGITSLCDFDRLFVEKLRQYNGTGTVFDYVDTADLHHSQYLDLNGDEQPDWLLAIPHPTLSSQGDVGVWAVLLTDMGTEAVRLTTLWEEGGETIEKISAEKPSPLSVDQSLLAILTNNMVSLFQLVKDDGHWEKRFLLNYGTVTDFNLQIVENNLQLDLLFDTATSYAGIDRITYRWDAEMEEFVEVERHAPNSLGIPFNEALDSAEALIFEEGDFTAAIPILTIIAEEFDPTGEFSWVVSLPKTLYLLGLANELAGNEGEAVAAYWRVWHDFPSDPYALMGAAKLEEK